jgi:hypothetical protein
MSLHSGSIKIGIVVGCSVAVCADIGCIKQKNIRMMGLNLATTALSSLRPLPLNRSLPAELVKPDTNGCFTVQIPSGWMTAFGRESSVYSDFPNASRGEVESGRAAATSVRACPRLPVLAITVFQVFFRMLRRSLPQLLCRALLLFVRSRR